MTAPRIPLTAATWPDGTLKSTHTAFSGHTGAAPIVWSTPAQASYATRVNAGFGLGHVLDVAGRKTVLMDPHASGLSIATEADKKFKRKKGAAI